jgi:hypothetical protein
MSDKEIDYRKLRRQLLDSMPEEIRDIALGKYPADYTGHMTGTAVPRAALDFVNSTGGNYQTFLEVLATELKKENTSHKDSLLKQKSTTSGQMI